VFSRTNRTRTECKVVVLSCYSQPGDSLATEGWNLLARLLGLPASQPTSCADLLALSLSPSNRSVRGDPKTAALSVALRLQSGEETRWLNALFTSELKYRITPFLSNVSSGTFRRVVS
jgi:hypothetical protein